MMTATATGYRTIEATEIVGVSYRQIDYWARTGLVVPSIADADGSGTTRRYSRADLIRLAAAARLLELGLRRPRLNLSLAAIDWGHPDASGVLVVGEQGITVIPDEDELLDHLWSEGVLVAVSPVALARQIDDAILFG